ncbi:tRNA (adenosine(37)-N6)-threonylcarbamoyltransferase complex dimerization subunit type 1 TsaB [Thiosulfatimonas sediminis]|uniref:tRNA threonylcarbamoyladenosine biosynthesis protein TsaB n=1 Tax=Thiosulfatimonas sediminis TaxID=2675054 RepID=A0A6F8PUV3_9GAMM|nr:tRNA (adenosine(37)-N6)-threonylcarbamoyltransferase complex dimerization subunit type 1 TsaB [Thiosulfatimonas sediminis]BBP45911.1 tRNA (adenosine(37)-N6)-threonylcarbamoyltransferase complex dimerization subunit type 1 TsaB [Thiosulfatimonas sediminis]
MVIDSAPQTLLALDTSTANCSVALLHQQEIYAIHEMTPQQHAHRILPMIDELLQQAGIDGSQIDLIAFGEGPGAFTGIRIAAGVVQGLALGWNTPFLAISSLEAMAYQLVKAEAGNQAVIWVALMDARMNELYWQQGTFNPNISVPWQAEVCQLLSPLAVNERLMDLQQQVQASGQVMIVVGDIEKAYPEIAQAQALYHDTLPNAHAMLRLAQQYYPNRLGLEQGLPMPLYLRNEVAETIEQRQARRIMEENNPN